MFISKRNNKVLLMGIIISMSVFYCGDPIPVEEMGNAKYEIARAESVKADMYAKEKYELARSTLFEAHDLVGNNKLKEAKAKAIEAMTLAQEAYNLAVPELARATRVEAEQMISEADRAFAEELAPDTYNNAKALLATGDQKTTEQKHFEAFQSFENSREEAIKARNQSEAQAQNLERELVGVEDLIKEAESYGANESTPDKITEAHNAVKRAREYLANKYLKDAHGEIVKAKQNATEAADLAKKDYASRKKLEASGEVESAEKDMVNLKATLENVNLKKNLSKSDEAQESLKNTEEQLSAAQQSLTNAGQTLEQQKYSESIDHSKEAIRLAKLVKDQIPALLVLIKENRKPDVLTQTKPETESRPQGAMAEGWKSYTVRLIPEKRDCLWRIAEYKTIYGDPFKWTRIYKANKSQIKNPDLIYPGQIFDIPPVTGDLTKPAMQPKKDAEIKNESDKEKSIERPRMNTEETKPEPSSDNTNSPADNIK
ncbi:MAG: hypothetical protein OEV66_07700 [Spirochaetia bacterium]|nr:hypothetical protein [Spirochaetia bacterium]